MLVVCLCLPPISPTHHCSPPRRQPPLPPPTPSELCLGSPRPSNACMASTTACRRIRRVHWSSESERGGGVRRREGGGGGEAGLAHARRPSKKPSCRNRVVLLKQGQITALDATLLFFISLATMWGMLLLEVSRSCFLTKMRTAPPPKRRNKNEWLRTP